MELVITESVHRESGELRFAAGAVLDFPKSTWNNIASSLGKSLGEFTAPPETLVARQRQADPGKVTAEAPDRPRRRVGRPRKTGV